jgi:hypothetical protein
MSNTPTPIVLDPLIKIGDVEREIAAHFDPDSRPGRRMITGWIDEGKLKGKQIGGVYYVHRSSLNSFLQILADQEVLAA